MPPMLIDKATTQAALAAVDWRAAAEETHNCYDVETERPGLAWLDVRTGEIKYAEDMHEIEGLVVLTVWETMEFEDPSMGSRPNTPTKVVKFAFATWVGLVSPALLERMERAANDYCSSAGW